MLEAMNKRGVVVGVLLCASLGCGGAGDRPQGGVGGTGGAVGGGSGGGAGGGAAGTVATGGTGTGGTEGGAQALYAPCSEGTQVGDFSLWLMATAMDSTSGSSVFNGTVWDRPGFSDHQHPVMSEGACTLMELDPAISCTPACTGTDVCYTDGTCAPNTVSRSVGTVQLSGLAAPVSFEPAAGDFMPYSSQPGQVPYPASAPGAPITLRASGGLYAPFTLAGSGLTPLWPRAGALTVTRDSALTFEWNAPDSAGRARVIAYINLGSNGGLEGGGIPGAGNIVCNFPDTGTGTVPMALLTQLIDQGVGSAPLLSIQRMTVSSTQLAGGCVAFSVVAPSSQPIVVD